MENNTMEYESVLPENFNGIFTFSNPSDEDFIGTWNRKEYIFKAGTTSGMIMPDHSPIEVQHIRKKFAKDLAEREFFKSKNYEHHRSRESTRSKNGMLQPTGQGMSHAGMYTLKDLEPYIQSCLQPLQTSQLMARNVKSPKLEETLSRNGKGELNTEVVDQKTSLRQKALNS